LVAVAVGKPVRVNGVALVVANVVMVGGVHTASFGISAVSPHNLDLLWLAAGPVTVNPKS
jgi:hypothetical protein